MGTSRSLAIEEQFYLLWPLRLLWIMRKPERAGRTVGRIILAIWLWRALLILRFGVGWSHADNAFDTRADALRSEACWPFSCTVTLLQSP